MRYGRLDCCNGVRFLQSNRVVLYREPLRLFGFIYSLLKIVCCCDAIIIIVIACCISFQHETFYIIVLTIFADTSEVISNDRLELASAVINIHAGRGVIVTGYMK